MPYQTLPIFSDFLLSAVIPSPPPLSLLPQEETDMESVEVDAVAVAALKSSFRPEMKAGRTTPHHHQLQASNDEVGGGDETFVDEFLNFSNEDVHGFVSENEEGEKEEEKNSSCGSVLSMEETHLGKTSDSNSNYDFGSVLSREETHLGKTSDSTSNYDFEPELCVPTDELENLEWLSHFVEDSFSKFPSPSDSFPDFRETPIPSEGQKSESRTETESKENRTGFLALTREISVPAKARRKRSRTGGRVWSSKKTHFTESSPTSSSSSSSSSSPSLQSSPSSCLIFSNTAQNDDLFCCLEKPPAKKPKKGKKKPAAVSDNSPLQPQRRCSHCLVQKTPQWRTGPLGAKTLCNACGVRYKSGRLLPEYRPAGSPTFLSNVHSNSHRKVLEMRRKKEVAGPEPGMLAVQSF